MTDSHPQTDKMRRRFLWGGFWLLFAAVHFVYLDKYPVVWVDDAMCSEPAWNAVLQGKFNTYTHPEGFGLEDHMALVGRIPHYLNGIAFALFGTGPFQARIVMLLTGLVSIWALYLLAIQLFNRKVAVLSSLLWAFSHTFFIHSHQARGDIMVALFFLLTFLCFIHARKRNSLLLFFLSGLTAALNLNVHLPSLSGIFMLFALVLLYFKEMDRKKVCAIAAGLAIGGLWWLGVHVLSELDSFIYQWVNFWKKLERSPLSGESKILQPLLGESRRYYEFFWRGRFHRNMFLFILFAASFAYGMIRRSEGTKFIVTILTTAFFCSAFLVPNKTVFYLVFFYPFYCLLAAHLLVSFLEENNRLKRWAAVLFLAGTSVLYAGENAYKLWKFRDASYHRFTDKVRQWIPPGSTVQAMASFWYDFRNDYRLVYIRWWYSGLLYRDTLYVHAREEIEDVRKRGVEYMIVSRDETFLDVMNPVYKEAILSFLKDHCVLVATVEDTFYGDVFYAFPRKPKYVTEIYKVKAEWLNAKPYSLQTRKRRF